MARMPTAVWKPLPNPSKSKMSRYDLYVVHTMVGSLTGTDGYFRGLTNGVNSHFGIGGYGENWQWVDTAVRSGANGEGNHRAITAENADMGPGFAAWDTRSAANVPALTPQQIETNAQNLAWAHREHGVPLQLAPNSLPGSRGLAYHRLGCDPYRVAGGEKWSSSYGKVCPADRRVAQIPQILARAKQIVAGAPAPEPEPEEYQDMKVIQADKRGIALVGAGYYQHLIDEEDVVSATKLWGPAHVDNERRFDVWVRQAIGGQNVSTTTTALTNLAARVADIDPADVDEEALAELLAPKLNGTSVTDIKAALTEVLGSVKLDTTVAPDPS